MNFFSGIIYPLFDTTTSSPTQLSFLIHAYAVLKAPSDIDLAEFEILTGPNYDSSFNTLGTTNRYSDYLGENIGLSQYNWNGVLNKRTDSNGILTFTPAEFENDINNILESSGSESNTADLIDSYTNDVLTLRGLKSSTIDFNVDDSGCLVMEVNTTISGSSSCNYWISGQTGINSLRVINSSSISATGDYAIATGFATNASGFASNAGGKDTTASGANSFTHGENNDSRASNSAILGGLNNTVINTSTNSVIIGGNNITATQSNTVYTPSIVVSGTVTSTGIMTAPNFVLSSDKRIKTDIEPISNYIIDVNWKKFKLNSDTSKLRYGVIAQELEGKHPEFVITDENGMKSVAYIDLLVAKINELENRIKILEK